MPIDLTATEKIYIDANTMYVDSFRMARNIWDDGFRPTFILGVWRGGTPIGCCIEEFFRKQGVRTFHTAIKTQSYEGIGERSSTVQVSAATRTSHSEAQ